MRLFYENITKRAVMIQGLQIRPAEAKDADAIFLFIEELEEVRFDNSLFIKCYTENLSGKNNIYLVAETEDKVIAGYISCHGQVLLHHLAMVFEIQELFVKEDYRGQKVGHQLLGAIEDALRERGDYLLEVTANGRRADTHLFYKNNGFIQTHQKFTKELKGVGFK